MRPVGKHTGERAAEVRSETTAFPLRRILLLALGVTATLVAWGVLVYAAIDFGQEARSGEPDRLGAAGHHHSRRGGLPLRDPDPRRADPAAVPGTELCVSGEVDVADSSDSGAAGSATGWAPGRSSSSNLARGPARRRGTVPGTP